ncbi:transcriptional regulator, LysR family [Bacteriovorax sp. BAL6_X]|uniref:LysR family transcriptional regulator n=1 Tax=Bacteriovorax sp. BAL6_X TaxID=1201290 RepID=UPI000386159C|nr:LysR family transcriptional regulator [Bacteriovorax sp. BAL6_X]EPZ51681.1 transcriptional regulator, LysR family [Bacteriovorax sp. BAL6_X]
MSLKLDDLKNFIVVSELKNVTRASEQLGLTQPALSYSIKRLEEELGAPVFIRLKSGIELTKFGEEFHHRANKLLQDWQDAKNIFNKEGEDIVGEFKVGIHPSVAIYSLPIVLPLIYKNFPRLNFRLIHDSSRVITGKVINFEADFGIVVNPIKHPDLIINEMGVDEVKLFESDRPKRENNKLIYNPQLAQSQDLLRKLKDNSILIDGHIESDNLEVIAKLTSEGVGIGLLPSRVASNYKNLVPINDSPIVKDQISLVYRVEMKNSLLVKDILEIVKDSLI